MSLVRRPDGGYDVDTGRSHPSGVFTRDMVEAIRVGALYAGNEGYEEDERLANRAADLIESLLSQGDE